MDYRFRVAPYGGPQPYDGALDEVSVLHLAVTRRGARLLAQKLMEAEAVLGPEEATEFLVVGGELFPGIAALNTIKAMPT